MVVEQKNPKAFSLAVRVYEELLIGVSRCFSLPCRWGPYTLVSAASTTLALD